MASFRFLFSFKGGFYGDLETTTHGVGEYRVRVWDYTQINPTLTPGVFDNVLSSVYWSATLFADDPSVAWGVIVSDGGVGAVARMPMRIGDLII